jgi:hypothetical protein
MQLYTFLHRKVSRSLNAFFPGAKRIQKSVKPSCLIGGLSADPGYVRGNKEMGSFFCMNLELPSAG